MSETRKLVAYFSRAGQNYVGGSIVDLPVGNSRVAAEAIAEKVGADLFEIETVDAYPADYTECTEVAAAEKRTGVRPELAADVDTDPYDVIYLCYPNWWGPAPWRSSRSSRDATSRTRLSVRSARTRAVAWARASGTSARPRRGRRWERALPSREALWFARATSSRGGRKNR